MAIDLDLLCSTLAIPVEKIGNNPNVTSEGGRLWLFPL